MIKIENSKSINMDFNNLEVVNESDCGCAPGCCDDNANKNKEIIDDGIVVNIKIDGQNVVVDDKSKNIVEIAKEAGISIPAPCFLSKKKNGCCKACVVEIDNKQRYACGTKAQDGMNIIVNRKDLKELRKHRLLKYKDSINKDTPNKCGIS